MSEPSAWQLEQVMSALMSARQRIAVETDEDVLAALFETETDAYKLLDGVIRAALEADSMADVAKARLDDLAARRKRYEARRDALRGVAFAAMDALSVSKLERPDFTASVGKPRAGIVITDESALPEEYIRVTRAPDKAKISEDLKQGLVITGAMVANGMPALTLRTK